MRKSTPITGLAPALEVSLALSVLALATLGGDRLTGQGPPEEAGGRLLERVQASDRAAGDLFACALSLSGPTLLAGSLLDDDRGSASGAAYVFDLGARRLDPERQAPRRGHGGGGPVRVLGRSRVRRGARPGLDRRPARRARAARPTASSAPAAAGAPGGRRRGGTAARRRADFGAAVALAPGWALVGAPLADAGGRPDAGAVYVFPLGGQDGGGAAPVRLEASAPQAAAGLGWAVAGTGEIVAAGAPWADAPLTGSGSGGAVRGRPGRVPAPRRGDRARRRSVRRVRLRGRPRR